MCACKLDNKNIKKISKKHFTFYNNLWYNIYINKRKARKRMVMRKIELTYEIKTANGDWRQKTFVSENGTEWERVVNIIHNNPNNPNNYRVLGVKHI